MHCLHLIILYPKKDFIIIFIASLSYFFGWVNNAYSLLQMEVQLFYTLRYTSTREVLYGWIHELCQLHTQERNRLWNLKLLGYQRGRPPKKALCVSRHTCGWVTFTITITLNLCGSILSKQTCVGQTRNMELIINSKWSKPIWWSKKTMILISHLFNFSAVCLLLLEFLLWNFFFDMLLYLQQDQVEKMYFEIVFNLSLHQVDDKATCQTRFNIFTLFLSPLWRLGPKISLLLSIFRLQT